VGIIRVHLEEDAGKSVHEGFPDSDRKTYVDFNRSGTPLIEIVTHPDLRSPEDAAEAFRRLREILIALGVNDGNMEEGSLRCDANVSVRPAGQETLGTKAEVKNINSFRFLERALEYEIARQTGVLQTGGTIVQETRLWDAGARETFSMRSKEDAHDYRYFPDPDLLPLEITPQWIDEVRRSMPETAVQLRAKLQASGISAYNAALLTESRGKSDLHVATTAAAPSLAPTIVANWINGEVTALVNDRGGDFDPGLAPNDGNPHASIAAAALTPALQRVPACGSWPYARSLSVFDCATFLNGGQLFFGLLLAGAALGLNSLIGHGFQRVRHARLGHPRLVGGRMILVDIVFLRHAGNRKHGGQHRCQKNSHGISPIFCFTQAA
jgi:aspartyl-tRNA(Asn)/glutamyl-tRNA(Gln) amidotransferase subunit B